MNKLYCLAIFILAVSCNSDKCFENYISDISCFENLQEINTNSLTKEIHFSKRLKCFEWDSLELGERGSYKNHPCIKFHQICAKGCGTYLGAELESHMDWFDLDRHWTFIYFYKNGTILKDAIAIPQSSYVFDKLKKNNQSNLFRKKKILDLE